MNTMRIVVILEARPLSRQIGRLPEQNTIKIVSTNGSHHPLNERLRNADIRNSLDLVDFENAQIGKPAMKPKQRIRVSTNTVHLRPVRPELVEGLSCQVPLVYKRV